MSAGSSRCVTELSVETLARAAQVLRLLAHPHRLKVIELLEAREDGAPVHEIAHRLRLPPAATSQHLNHMRRVGLVAARRSGRTVRYRIADARSLRILNCIRGGPVGAA
jgi:DNA-binding transcriptional ArsR family regulator